MNSLRDNIIKDIFYLDRDGVNIYVGNGSTFC